MKSIVFILFPFCLSAQTYRLDSIWYIDPSRSSVDRFYYQDTRNFELHQTDYDLEGAEESFVSIFEDSLLVKQIGNSGTTYFEYDELRRKTRETRYKLDSIRQDYQYTYYQATNLLTDEQRINYRDGDTSYYYLNHIDYDSLLRDVHTFYFSERSDTFYNSGEIWRNFVNDSLTYNIGVYTKAQVVGDTSYSKTISLPDYYFGDTLRTWQKYYDLTRDSIILDSDERVQFTWGDFFQFEDAGNCTYLHGILYGSFIEFEPTSDGYTFAAYESSWPEGDPVNWKEDIEKFDLLTYEGTLKVNDAGLPIVKILLHSNGIHRTEWYYSKLSSVDEVAPPTSCPVECKIIKDLLNDSIYYDMTGKRVHYSSGTQYLLEQHNQKLERVLFIND